MVSKRIWTPHDDPDDSLDLNDDDGDVSEPKVQESRHKAWRQLMPLVKDLRRIREFGVQDGRDERMVQVVLGLVIVELMSRQKGM